MLGMRNPNLVAYAVGARNFLSRRKDTSYQKQQRENFDI